MIKWNDANEVLPNGGDKVEVITKNGNVHKAIYRNGEFYTLAYGFCIEGVIRWRRMDGEQE